MPIFDFRVEFVRVVFTGFMLIACANTAHADAMFNTPASGTPPVSGLNDFVYHLGTAQPNPFNPNDSDITSLVNYAATHAANYSFVNTQTTFSYTGGDVTPTNVFLGADAAGRALTDVTPLQTSILDARGYIYIPVAGTYVFDSSNADDAMRVYIGGDGSVGSGTDVLERSFNFFSSPPNVYTGPANVTFSASGYYGFELFYYNQYSPPNGDAALNFSITAPMNSPGVSFASQPAPVPLPRSAWCGLFLLSAIALTRARSRSRAQA